MSFMCFILTPINLYTTPLLNSWQQLSPPEICNHTCDIMLYNSLGKISGIFHCNNQNNWLERRVWPPRDVLWMPSCGLKHLT